MFHDASLAVAAGRSSSAFKISTPFEVRYPSHGGKAADVVVRVRAHRVVAQLRPSTKERPNDNKTDKRTSGYGSVHTEGETKHTFKIGGTYSRPALACALSNADARWPRALDGRTYNTPRHVGWMREARRRCVGAAAAADIAERAPARGRRLLKRPSCSPSPRSQAFSSSAVLSCIMFSRFAAFARGLRFRRQKRSDSLEREIMRGRKRLARCPSGHPQRADACFSLAYWLDQHFRETGSLELLEEKITLNREALSLRPAGHPDRDISCNNLANALCDRYEVTGVTALLDEAITLHRENLSLRPAGHRDRDISCNNLASALRHRYNVTGVTALLDEAITLHREALSLRPVGHPDRAMSCSNLANALQTRYEVTGVSALLDEAITLHREDLSLTPAGHPDRAISCNNLANALRFRYEVTGATALLDEAITLYREALSLRPVGHPYRAISCINLADQLLLYFQKTQDMTAIDEALILARESAASASPSFLWRPLLTLCEICTGQGSPHLSISTATEYLSQASAMHPDNITDFMPVMRYRLALIWSMQSTWTADVSLLLLGTYSNLVDMLSRMTGFVLDIPSQLTALKSARLFGSDACIAALLSHNPRQAMELVDRAHGVIWAQALHQRNAQLQQLPEDLASELGMLLRATSGPVVASGHEASQHCTPGFLSPQDVRHEQNSRIQTLLTEIRAMPGLDRFMLGHTYAELRKTANKHPVVVLVAARGQAYALIISNSTADSPYPLTLSITSDSLASLRDYAGRAGLRNGQSPDHMDADARLGLAKPVKKDASMAVLSELWLYVVKPVLDYLQLQVQTAQWIHRTATADMFSAAYGRSLAPTIVLVSHWRLCLPPIARSGHLSRTNHQTSVLC
jgi:tetratricopeptide (TPR) repeat protein